MSATATMSVQDLVDHLIERTEALDHDAELEIAVDFVFQHGTLAGVIPDPEDLDEARHAGTYGTAWAMLSHWSGVRHEPNVPAFISPCARCGICPALDAALGLRHPFLHGDCSVCGGGVDTHAVVTDDISSLNIVCCGRWQRYEPLAGPAGDASPEQIGDAWNAKWAAPLADGSWAVVYRTYYVARDPDRPGMVLERQDEYLTCADPSDPGGTENGPGDLRFEVLDSLNPLGEDIHSLAEHAFPPMPGEWQTYVPHSAAFANAEG